MGDAVVLAGHRMTNRIAAGGGCGRRDRSSPRPAPPWSEGPQRARRDWLLCLADGDVPTGRLDPGARPVHRLAARRDRRFGAPSRRPAGTCGGDRVLGGAVHRPAPGARRRSRPSQRPDGRGCGRARCALPPRSSATRSSAELQGWLLPRFRCSSRRGMISTKLHGRCR